MKKIKEIFIKSNEPWDISPCYHGYCYYDFIKNKYITVILPFNFIVMIFRSFYLMLKFSGYEMDNFYKKQCQLRNKKLPKKNKIFIKI